MPEAGVDKVTGNVLHTAVVPVNLTPVLKLFHIGKALCVVGVDISQEVPGRACPLGHGVGLPLCCAAALGAGAVDERINFGKGAFAVLTGLEVFNLGQFKRKLLVGNGNHTALVAVNNRNRLAPIALSVECPVLHLVLNTLLADTLLFKLNEHTLD